MRLRLRLRRRPSLILIFTASEKHPSRVPLCTRALGSSRAPRPREKNSRKPLLARRSNTWKRRLFWISDKISTKKKNIRVTEIPYASTRNTRKKYRTTPAVPKGHRLLRSPTVCRVFSQFVTRRSASAPLIKTLFLRSDQIDFFVSVMSNEPRCRRGHCSARGRGRRPRCRRRMKIPIKW